MVEATLTLLLLLALHHARAFVPPRLQHAVHHRASASSVTRSCVITPSRAAAFDNIVAVVPSTDLASPFKNKPFYSPVSWGEVLDQVKSMMSWEGLNVTMSVTDSSSFVKGDASGEVAVLIGFNETTPTDMQALRERLRMFSSVSVFDSHESVLALQKYGAFSPDSPMEALDVFIDDTFAKDSARRKQRKAYQIAQESWDRRSSADILFMLLVLTDTFSTPIKSVQSVTSTETTGLSQLTCMCSNCADEMIKCFANPRCRAALDCLNSCRGNDQVCQYRCITSYETQEFENFARCILQRHNCMGNSATIPRTPDPEPLRSYRGAPLTYETAQKIFEGHVTPRPGQDSLLSGNGTYLPQSWMVVCGQNPAYDYFSCQHQIFYSDSKNSSVFWYDPVFRVVTLDGREVWRRRHYRVRRGKTPGTFYFSVLDNGVVSNEFWRILDCADDLSWGVFYYGGAASAAGTSYRGALIVSPDGKWPKMTDEVYARIERALATGGINMWEMFEVSNVNCYVSPAGLPPLSYE